MCCGKYGEVMCAVDNMERLCVVWVIWRGYMWVIWGGYTESNMESLIRRVIWK